jgi:long-subunit acyl-CoA synthetase (AMP-forming)
MAPMRSKTKTAPRFTANADGSKTVMTSGTTGSPKTITMSKAVWEARLAAMVTSKPPGYAAIKSWFNETRKDAVGFQKHADYAAKHGVTIHTPPGATVAETIAFWKANSPQGIISSAAGLTNYALANPGYQFQMLIATGAMLSTARSKMIRAALGDNLFVSYASTETDTISFASAADVEANKTGYVGKPVPGVTVSIIDGEVCVKTPCLATGAAVDAQGWYHTGDLGALDNSGAITLSGRKMS